MLVPTIRCSFNSMGFHVMVLARKDLPANLCCSTGRKTVPGTMHPIFHIRCPYVCSMIIRSAWLFVLSLPTLLGAQVMQLASGTLNVAEGTHLRVEGSVTWEVLPGAQVVNDGLIDLGVEATLVETAGSPIVGSGVETAVRTYSLPISDEEPGGLGLMLGSTTAPGEVTLTRGHVPFVLPNMAESIGRWYRLESNDLSGAVMNVVLRYDDTELNGLFATQLQLHKALDTLDYWNPLPGNADPGQATVSAVMAWPWNFLTAFEQDVVMGLAEPDGSGMIVHPTVTDGIVNMSSEYAMGIQQWVLYDVHGARLAEAHYSGIGNANAQVDLASYVPGVYILRVNGTFVQKLIRP